MTSGTGGDSYILDKSGIARYLSGLPDIARRLGGAPASWTIEEISDGNVNYVFGVHGNAGSICVKQAPPYVRVAGPAWPLAPGRIGFENAALVEHHKHAPRFVPGPLHYDAEHQLMVVEYLEDCEVLRYALTAGKVHQNLARDLGDYLALTLFWTSDLAMPAARKRALSAVFEGNAEMTGIMESMIFTEIYTDHPRNTWTRPFLDDAVAEIQSDDRVKLAVSRLKLRYMTCKQALLHGDLHTGSAMVSGDRTWIIDQEFACYGPIAYDIGILIAHLIISYFACDGNPVLGGRRAAFQSQVLDVITGIWRQFRTTFLSLWESGADGDAYPTDLFPDEGSRKLLAAERGEFVDRLLPEAISFCAAEILRRIIGFASVSDFTGIQDEAIRAACERRSLVLAKTLLVADQRPLEIVTLTELVKRIREESMG